MLLVITATLNEVWRESSVEKPLDSVGSERDKIGIRLLRCFSVVNNSRKLFSTEEDNAKNSLSCLHGIRVLTTCWIVILHVIVEVPDRYGYRKKFMEQVNKKNITLTSIKTNRILSICLGSVSMGISSDNERSNCCRHFFSN